MSGAAPRPVVEWQLGNFGQSATVGIPFGMRLDVWNDTGDTLVLNLYARNGQSIVAQLNQNASVALSGRLFSSVTLSSLNSGVLWALVDESSPSTWGPVTGDLTSPFVFATFSDPLGNKLPAAWDGSGPAPAQGRFVGYLVSNASGDVSMAVGAGPAVIPGTATAQGQTFPFVVFVGAGQQVSLANATIAAAGITL